MVNDLVNNVNSGTSVSLCVVQILKIILRDSLTKNDAKCHQQTHFGIQMTDI